MMTERHLSTRRNHKEQTRRRIVAAAAAMLRESAAEALTMARVGARAGVTERTVYRHFPSRDALIRAGWASAQGHVLDSVRAALPDLDETAVRRRAAAVQLIRSAQGQGLLRDLGLDRTAAGQAASEAEAILLGLQPVE